MRRPMPVPGEPPRVRYRGRARAILEQIVRASCPPDVDELRLTDEIVGYIEDALSYAPAFMARALALGLYTLDVLSLADGPRRVPFSRLGIEDARAYVEGAFHTRNLARSAVIRQVRMLALLGYYESPTSKERLGYAPDAWIEKSKAERLRRHADDL
ncbi:MAG: hypothetical protein HYY06_29850 [Deltaproteobacteria bacterium]|nr:hypothetical protein [Deltaproteobacteria bacterium]